MGHNPAAENGQKYMVSFCHTNDIFRSYEGVLVSDDYTEIAGLYGKRISEMAEKIQSRIETIKSEIDIEPITTDSCFPLSYQDDINDKIIAIKADVLRPEFQRADCQIYLVNGGFGASANSRGNSVYCTNLYTGKETRFERYDVLGVIKPEKLPEWAKMKESEIRIEKNRPKEKESSEVR